MNAAVLLCALCLSGAVASPTNYDSDSAFNSADLLQRESQLLSITEGARQLSLLLSELYQRGSEKASSLRASVTPSEAARTVHHSDPVELALNTIELDTEPCRQRLACELQSVITSYSLGGAAYELMRTGVPALKRYGYVSTRNLGVTSCRQAFPCRFAASPLMGSARQARSLATAFCDMEGDSYTSRICRAVTLVVDTLETL